MVEEPEWWQAWKEYEVIPLSGHSPRECAFSAGWYAHKRLTSIEEDCDALMGALCAFIRKIDLNAAEPPEDHGRMKDWARRAVRSSPPLREKADG